MQPESNKRTVDLNTRASRAAIYCRVSTGIQEDGYSLGFQEQQCRDHAADRGYEVAAVYADVHTGAVWRERKALTELRQLLRAGGVDVVLCYALDRLSRDQTHIAVLVDDIEHGGARLELVTEEFEDSAVGKFIRSAKAFAAEVEREKTLMRSMDGRKARVMSGKYLPGPRALYGYRWADDEKSKLEIDPVSGPIARRIFDEAASGKPLRNIAYGLTDDGIPTPTGKQGWSHQTVATMLHHPAYCGRAYGWSWRSTNGTKNAVFDAEGAIALPEGTVPAIIEVAAWEMIQDRLTRNKRQAARNNKQPHEALMCAGLATCGHCGHTMHVHNRQGTGPGLVYECTSGANKYTGCKAHIIVVHKVDDAVWSKLKGVMGRRGVIADEIQRMLRDDPTTADLESIERRLRAVETESRNLVRQLAGFDDIDAAASVRADIEALSKQRRALETEGEAIENQRRTWENARAYLDDLDDWLDTVAVNMESLSYEQKRDLLDLFGFRVTVWNSKRTPRVEIESKIDLDKLSDVSTTCANSGHNVLILRWPGEDAAAD